MALQNDGCRCMCTYTSECDRQRERKWEMDRKCRRGSPEGLINQARAEREAPGGSCMKRQVSIAFWVRGYGQTHQSSQTHTHPHTDSDRAGQGRNYPETKPISFAIPHYYVTVLRLIFGCFLNGKHCCDQIPRALPSRFCKLFTIDYSGAYCVPLCFSLSL